MAERTMMADRNGRELFLGDTVRAAVAEPFREIGPHGDWAEYEITKAPGGYALTYLRSMNGAVLPYGYISCLMTDFDSDELPSAKDLIFARRPVPHPSLTWVEDGSTAMERETAFSVEATARRAAVAKSGDSSNG